MTAAESMKVNPPTRTALIGSIIRALPAAAFYLFFWLYLIYEVDLRLLYNGAGLISNFPTFYLDGIFLKSQLAYPGGFIEYVSAFLAQLFYYSWAGAAVVTCQAWLIGLGADAYLRAIGAARLRVLRFVGPLILLAAYSQYVLHLTSTVAFTFALSAVWLCLKFAPQTALRRGLAFLVASVVLYAATGAAYLLFALLFAGAQIITGRRYLEALLYALSAAVIPYVVGVLAWGFPLLDSYTHLLPIYLGTRESEPPRLLLKAVQVLYLFLPMVLALVTLWYLTLGRRTSPASRGMTKLGVLRLAIETILLAAATVGTVFFYRDPGVRNLFAVDYYSRQGMWSDVLETARYSRPHYLICHAVNRALSHTGRLGDDMFTYFQDPNALFLTAREALWQKADTYTDLGLLGEAEFALTSSLQMFGEKPTLLQRLARINMAKGDLSTAGVYLSALSKVPFWRGWATENLARLQSDPNLSQAQDIQQLRSVRLKQDFVRQVDMVSYLLAENPKNRMAYDYGMAYLLLTRNLGGFIRFFGTHRDAGESRIPRHYEEAFLLARRANLEGPPVSPESANRFASFMKALEPFQQNPEGARRALRGLYGDTYYYYFFFGSSGVQ